MGCFHAHFEIAQKSLGGLHAHPIKVNQLVLCEAIQIRRRPHQTAIYEVFDGLCAHRFDIHR